MNPWTAIAAVTESEYQTLLHDLYDCAKTQRQQLKSLLLTNKSSQFGQRFHFGTINEPERYQSTIPLQNYSDLAQTIERMMAGEEGELFEEKVLLYEETGGSSAASKLIPYTESSLTGFRRAVYPWLHDLARQYPQLGRSYFAISPAARVPKTTASGIMIGAGSDAIYFGRQLLEPLMAISAVPEQLGSVTDMEQWQRLTLLYLLHAEDLTLFSVWSPSFLTSLLAELPRHVEWLLRELHDGSTALPGAPVLAAAPQRAALLRQAMVGGSLDTRLLWPQLQLISCWTHAGAKRFIPQLQQLFPHVTIQGKGLLATEGVISIPLVGHDYPVLAVNSGFYEFLDETGNLLLAHELADGGAYEVIISVPGLWRYRIGDWVRVRGWIGSAPKLEFLGRGKMVCDLVGEKLNDAFVADCLQMIDGFAMLAPASQGQPRYQLFTEKMNEGLLSRVEQALRRNPQYAYACDLGQLGPLQLIVVEHPWPRYQSWALGNGQRLGDIKPPSLRTETDWEQRLCQ